ncbi:LysM peptidoglycan-binding domain-containing protein [Bacillus sp. T3]|uniref:LysM peptidoglycan-binding domain-containing protein n=1 Tax=Bacillus sp. T3 TaxID=467262 RepID=UPI002981020F|nr:LysM peptidoglycan-binding domain-containing protein [Bacillus sp. T3]
MNREDPYRQQTESTRRRIGRATISSSTNGEKSESTSLPPRSEVHHQKRTKNKTKSEKQSFPLIRLQVVFFILLPIIIFAIYTYRDNLFPNSTKTGMEEKSGYETISIEDSNAVDKKNSQKAESKESDENGQQTSAEDKSEAVSDPAADQTTSEPTTESSAGGVSGTATVSETPDTPVVSNAPANNTKDNSQEIKLHTVQKGETLYRIAMKYYQSKSGVDIIKKANNLKSDSISVGQTLKIPI